MNGSPVEWRIAVAACDSNAMSDLMRRMYENAARIVPSTRYFCGDCGTCGLAGQWEIEIWNVAQGLTNPRHLISWFIAATLLVLRPIGMNQMKLISGIRAHL